MVCWIHYIFFVRWGAHKYKKKKSGYRYIVSRYNVLKKKKIIWIIIILQRRRGGRNPRWVDAAIVKLHQPLDPPPPKEERFVCMHPLYTRPLVKLKLNWSLANNKICFTNLFAQLLIFFLYPYYQTDISLFLFCRFVERLCGWIYWYLHRLTSTNTASSVMSAPRSF